MKAFLRSLNSVGKHAGGRLRRLHRDEVGSISIASVFALLLLVYLLGMVMNSSRQVDNKVRMQNAADAATYTGGVVLARSMNTLAFTNHMLSDVFALTAFMREARDRKAESLTPEILANWERIGPAFSGSEYPKFAALGNAISEKVPHERNMVFTYSEWAAAGSEIMLPVFETILAERLIPQFQRSLVMATPQLAQYAADEVARRHGQSWPRKVELRAVLWRTIGDPLGGVSEDALRSIPAVDPVMDDVPNRDDHIEQARRERQSMAFKYLRAWNAESLSVFDDYGKMSQFSNLWRIFTRGNLYKLLNEEYRYDNLPFQIRTADGASQNDYLEQNFMFVGVVYREKSKNWIPGIFKSPVASDRQAYAQINMFVPRRRLLKAYRSTGSSTDGSSSGSFSARIPGDERLFIPRSTITTVPPAPATDDGSGEDEEPEWYATRQWRPRYEERWDLMNQNWTMQLAPATARMLPQILSTPPYVNGLSGVQTPDLSSISVDDIHWLSHH